MPYAHIDLVFGLDADGSLALMSPSAANGDGFSLTSWDQLNSTTIVPSSHPLLNPGGVKAAIDSGNLSPKVPAQRGWYALRLSNGALAALYVSLISAPSDTATTTIEVFK